MSEEKSQLRKVIDLVVTMVICLIGIVAYASGDTMVVRFLNIPIPAWIFVPLAILTIIYETNSLINGANKKVLYFLGVPAIVLSAFLLTGLVTTLIDLLLWTSIPNPIIIIVWILVGSFLFVKIWLPNYRERMTAA